MNKQFLEGCLRIRGLLTKEFCSNLQSVNAIVRKESRVLGDVHGGEDRLHGGKFNLRAHISNYSQNTKHQTNRSRELSSIFEFPMTGLLQAYWFAGPARSCSVGRSSSVAGCSSCSGTAPGLSLLE